MKKVKLIVENVFVESTRTSEELHLTVFERVFKKLLVGSGSIGKIHPLYIKVGNSYKIFGILTLNQSGSYSFFPELPSGLEFDHVTFVQNLSKGNHHYTRVTSIGREKILPIFAEYLSNGVYHGVTFKMDSSFLKDAPKEAIYPEINLENLNEIKKAFFTLDEHESSTILVLEPKAGTICVQFFLIPKEVDYKKIAIYPPPIEKFEKNFHINTETQINTFNAIIPHEYQQDYALGIIVFIYKNKSPETLEIVTAVEKKGFYSKIDIEYR